MSTAEVHRLDIDGELTIGVAVEQHHRLMAFLATGTALELGLAGVVEMDTAGLQVLLAVRREAMRQEVCLTLCDSSQAVLDVLAIAHLGTDLEPAREAA